LSHQQAGFMWPYPTRPTNLLATAHRNSIHDVFVFDTARDVEIYRRVTTHGYEHRRDDLPTPPWPDSFMTRVRTCAYRGRCDAPRWRAHRGRGGYSTVHDNAPYAAVDGVALDVGCLPEKRDEPSAAGGEVAVPVSERGIERTLFDPDAIHQGSQYQSHRACGLNQFPTISPPPTKASSRPV
jgi:hypothetical protein